MDVRVLLGIALVVVAFGGGLAFWNAARQTTPLMVAARDIPPGHTVTEDDLTVSEARVEGALGGLTVSQTDLDSLLGQTATEPIHAGALVLRPAVGSGPTIGPADVAVTVPVDANAVYPRLRPGDSVAVLATGDKAQPSSQTTTLLERATVYDIAADATGTTLGSEAATPEDRPVRLTSVTVIVPRAQVEQVTHALVGSRLTFVLLQRQAE